MDELARRRKEIEDTFDPWWTDVRSIARLYRWLRMRDRLPEDTADFIANARSWEQDYEDMCMWAGPA